MSKFDLWKQEVLESGTEIINALSKLDMLRLAHQIEVSKDAARRGLDAVTLLDGLRQEILHDNLTLSAYGQVIGTDKILKKIDDIIPRDESE